MGLTSFKCIEVVEGSHATLMEVEIRLISHYGSVAPYGYNLTHGGDGVDYSVPGVRERHLKAMRELPLDPIWVQSLKDGIKKRQMDPESRANQLAGVRQSHLNTRSKVCTLCGGPLDIHRSWCTPCKKDYHKDYNRKYTIKLKGQS